MRHSVFLTIVLVLAATAGAQDWEGDLLGAEAAGDLHGTLGVTWDSEFIWRGFKMFDNKSATHIVGDLNLWETGFGLSAAGHYANGSGHVDATRWDYTGYYQNGLFAGEPYATNFRLGYVFYDHPYTTSEWSDLQEAHVVVSWPNLLPIPGLCPTYVAAKVWPGKGDSRLEHSADGWFHIFMLDYGFTVQGVLPDIPEHLIRLHGEIVYNDGVDPIGPRIDNQFSHAVFGVATDVKFGDDVTLTPAVYYQMAMERGLEERNGDSSDELWASVGLTYSF
jgi:hypothetical protein